MQVFKNPYKGQTFVWNAQGARISWGVGKNAASSAYAELNSSGSDNGHRAFACLTGLSVQFQRDAQTMYPIGSQHPIRLLGAPKGTCQITSLLGPTTQLQSFIRAAGSDCQAIVIAIQPFASQDSSCAKDSNQPIIVLKGCSLNAIGLQIQNASQGFSMINIPLNLEFTDLEWNN